MRRDIPRLAETQFDLLVVGAGIFGACAAWDASLRGLTVAVVDQDDFGAATSANSLRIVHGGLRYLARGDFRRMRESIRERSALLRIAPGLVQPLEVVVPTYGHAAQGRLAHGAALALNDLLSVKRNAGLGQSSRMPGGHLLSRDECLASFPWFPAEGLTGGAVWYDAQLRHPERLTLSFLRSAARLGAQPGNYLRVNRLLTGSGAVHGAHLTDRLTGTQFEIRARAVLVAAGPWTDRVVNTALSTPTSPGKPPQTTHALALNIVVRRRLAEVAVGVRARSGSQEDPVGGGGRFLFCAPQGEGTVLGTWYAPSPVGDESTRTYGARALVKEFNDACPGLDLVDRDVVDCQWGWLPLKNGQEPGRPDALAERPRITDHGATQEGVRHLISVEGVKFTTARRVVERAVDRVFVTLGRAIPPCRTAEQQLDDSTSNPAEITETLSKEEIFRAVRQEMAVKLSDLVFRRTGLGAAPRLQRQAVEAAARAFAAEIGWDERRVAEEVEEVMREAGAPRGALETVA